MAFQEFESGAVRDTQQGKIKFELITPTFKKDLAAMLTAKAEHYGDRNWEKGIPTARTFSSLMRHIEALGRGEWLDEESGHPHTVLAAANLMFIHEFHGTEFDTLYELVGPALREKSIDGQLNKLVVKDIGQFATYLEYGANEPPHDTVWQDSAGDIWQYGYKPSWSDQNRPDGWYVTERGELPSTYRYLWSELTVEDDWPWVRVS